MVSKRASFFEDNCVWLHLIFTTLHTPLIHLDTPLTIVKADCIWILQYNKFLLKSESSSFIGVFVGSLIIFIPIKIYSFARQLSELSTRIEESNFHIVGEHKHTTQDMIVVIVPDILICKRDYHLLQLDIDNLKALFTQVSEGQILFMNTEWFTVSTYCLIDIKVNLALDARFNW